MKKHIMVCFCLFATPLLSAQTLKGIKPLARALTIKSTPALQQTIRRAPGLTNALHRQFINHLLTPSAEPAVFLTIKHTEKLTLEQILPIYQNYEQILAEFNQFKKESIPFLYYQTLPHEFHSLSPAERTHWAHQITSLYAKIMQLNHQVEDPSLQEAIIYLKYALQVIDPALLQTLTHMPASGHTSVNLSTFCLYPSAQMPIGNPAVELAGKSMAIVNDNVSILDFFQQFYNFGVLFPHAQLTTHTSAANFLTWMETTSTLPDIIFTDIQLSDGTGYYIAKELREKGYKGGIIALTSYKENQTNAEHLAAQGFDGFISLHNITSKIPVQRLNQATQIYFNQQKNAR